MGMINFWERFLWHEHAENAGLISDSSEKNSKKKGE
jgi:hypothetical protein